MSLHRFAVRLNVSLLVGVWSIVFSQTACAQVEVIKGKLLSTDPPDPLLRKISQGQLKLPHKVHKIRLNAGKGVVIDFKADVPGLNPYLRIEDPLGNHLARDDNGGAGANARLPLVPHRTGDYRIIAISAKGSGPYTIAVRPAWFAVAGDLKSQSKSYSAQMEANVGYVIDLRGDAPNGPPSFDTVVRLHAPGGIKVAEDDDGGDRLDSRIVYVPKRAGTYRFVVTSYSGKGRGKFTLAVYPLDQAELIAALQAQARAQETARNLDAAATSLSQMVGVQKRNYGSEHWRTGDAERALADLERRRRMNPAELQDLAEADALHRRVYKLWREGKSREALKLADREIIIRRRLLGLKHRHSIRAMYNFAAQHLALGNYAQALPLYQQVSALRKEVLGEKHPDYSSSLNNLSVLYHFRAEYAKALSLAQRASKVDKAAMGEKSREYARSLAGVAEIYRALGQYEKALPLQLKVNSIIKEVLPENHPDYATALNNLAALYQARKEFAKARPLLERTLKLRREYLGELHPNYAVSLENLGALFFAQKQFAKALDLHWQASDVFKTALGENHPRTANSLFNIATAFHAQGNYLKAEELYREGAKAFLASRRRVGQSGLDRTRYTSHKSRHDDLAGILAHNGKPLEAWHTLEQGLGRSTWDEVTARLHRSAGEQTQLDRLQQRIRNLDTLIEQAAQDRKSGSKGKLRLRQWQAEQRQGFEELNKLHRRLEQKYGIIEGAVYSIERIQDALAEDAALLTWVDVPRQHWAVLVRSKGPPRWIRLPRTGPAGGWSQQDEDLPKSFGSQLINPKRDWLDKRKAIIRQRISPIRKHLAGVNHLFVLPSTKMDGIPIELLVNDTTVSYVSSGTIHGYLRFLKPPQSRGLLALGDPVFRRDKNESQSSALWQELPGTRAEIESLRGRFEAGKKWVAVLTDSAASEQSLLQLRDSGGLSRFRYLHFATHGEINAEKPWQSAIILSMDRLPENPFDLLQKGLPMPDGRLTAAEVVQNWKLNAELVTLSACQSGLGKHERGEGFMGFSQALLLAGARSVVLSLWKVDDTATALLMDRFYENLLGQRKDLIPMPKAKALAEAKNWLRTLPRSEVENRAAKLTNGVARGKGRKDQPLLRPLPKPAQPAAKDAPPYAHPYYWAAFILIGDPR